MPPAPGRRFAGHSGARLTLFEAAAPPFVRKSAGAAADNARLENQCERLTALHAQGTACPAVYGSGLEDDRFYFDMEYIQADSLSHIILSGHPAPWDEIIAQILTLINSFRAREMGDIPASAFLTKIDAVLARCTGNPAVSGCLNQLNGLASILRGLDWSGVPASDCHGDFTLENMLLRQDKTLIFIDFDLPEQSSWMLDIGKIYQDVLGHWCLRHAILANPQGTEALNAQLRMSRLASRLAPAVTNLIPGGRSRLIQLTCFHLFRTLPYMRDAAMASFVVQRMTMLLTPEAIL